MVIKASSAEEIRRLIDALGGTDDVRREAAVARLAIIGARTVDRLVAAFDGAAPLARGAILRVLEAIGDPRALPVARAALAAGGDEAVAAAGTLRALVDAKDARIAAGALDALVAAALDARAERRVRLAAFDGMQELPPSVREPVAAALRADRDPAVSAKAGAPAGATGTALDALWRDALEGRLPDDPAALREGLQARAASTPLSALQKLVDAVRAREQGARGEPARAAWLGLRGAIHQALALRGSRIAVYDLRETLERAAGPLPVSFLAALHVVGDGSCLVPLASAHARAGGDPAWRHQVAAAFHAVARRERLTKRHAVMKRIAAKYPDVLAAQ
jgi:hypothetical protein